jgi:hypothetical protein
MRGSLGRHMGRSGYAPWLPERPGCQIMRSQYDSALMGMGGRTGGAAGACVTGVHTWASRRTDTRPHKQIAAAQAATMRVHLPVSARADGIRRHWCKFCNENC